MIDDDLLESVRNGLLDADHACRYWNAMTLRYVRRERIAKIFLAAVASATVAGWGFWKEATIVWQGLSITAALLSVALPIFDVPRMVETMTELQEGWNQVQSEYEAIWEIRKSARVEEVQARLDKIRPLEAVLARKAAKAPGDDEKLGAKVYNDVIRERGLRFGKKEI